LRCAYPRLKPPSLGSPDAHGSGACSRKGVEVRALSSAPTTQTRNDGVFSGQASVKSAREGARPGLVCDGCATSSRTYRRNRHHLHQVSSCDAVPGNMVRCPIRSRLSTPELIPRSRRTPRDSAERPVDGFGSPVEMLLRHEQIRRHRRHRHVPRWPHERVDESVNTFTEPDRLDWARRSSGCGPLVGRSARGSQESGAAGRELHLPGRRASGRRNADVEAM
jgi:hypothetical protein